MSSVEKNNEVLYTLPYHEFQEEYLWRELRQNAEKEIDKADELFRASGIPPARSFFRRLNLPPAPPITMKDKFLTVAFYLTVCIAAFATFIGVYELFPALSDFPRFLLACLSLSFLFFVRSPKRWRRDAEAKLDLYYMLTLKDEMRVFLNEAASYEELEAALSEGKIRDPYTHRPMHSVKDMQLYVEHKNKSADKSAEVSEGTLWYTCPDCGSLVPYGLVCDCKIKPDDEEDTQ